MPDNPLCSESMGVWDCIWRLLGWPEPPCRENSSCFKLTLGDAVHLYAWVSVVVFLMMLQEVVQSRPCSIAAPEISHKILIRLGKKRYQLAGERLEQGRRPKGNGRRSAHQDPIAAHKSC